MVVLSLDMEFDVVGATNVLTGLSRALDYCMASVSTRCILFRLRQRNLFHFPPNLNFIEV